MVTGVGVEAGAVAQGQIAGDAQVFGGEPRAMIHPAGPELGKRAVGEVGDGFDRAAKRQVAVRLGQAERETDEAAVVDELVAGPLIRIVAGMLQLERKPIPQLEAERTAPRGDVGVLRLEDADVLGGQREVAIVVVDAQ